MKKMMLVTLPFIASTVVAAQIPSVAVDTVDKKSQLLGAIKNNLLTQGRFSHATSRGKIYTLPYDNMPCLVPDMDQLASMPNSVQRVPESRMPNATPRREMIPKQKRP